MCREPITGIDVVNGVNKELWCNVQASFPTEVALQKKRLDAAGRGEQASTAELQAQFERHATKQRLRAEMEAHRRTLQPVCREYFDKLELELANVDGVFRCECRGTKFVCLPRIAQSEKNRGRRFYKCPLSRCRFFQWASF